MLHLRRLQNSIRCTPQSALAGLLVFLLLAASGALPLTQVVVIPATRISHAEQARLAAGRPFPCQTHRCGCHSAEGCGTKCCCFSPAQVAAWYEQHADDLAAYDAAHGLDSPPVVDFSVPVDFSVTVDVSVNVEANADVRASSRRRCCTEHVDGETTVETAAKTDAEFPDVSAEPNDEQLVTLPISIDAVRRCQGLSSLWLLLAQALPADSTPLWQFDESTTATVDVYVAVCPEVAVRPDIPPPRA
ncbi:MAG: hypothetical protein U0939_05720 [Pirellulales bacterium]